MGEEKGTEAKPCFAKATQGKGQKTQRQKKGMSCEAAGEAGRRKKQRIQAQLTWF